MKPSPPPLTKDLIEAFIASAVAWLVWLAGAVARLGAPRKTRRLHHFICELERSVEAIAFLKAVHAFAPPPKRRHAPRAAPPGFRRAARARMRLFFRNSGIRARKAGLIERLTRLLAVLSDLAPHAVYFHRRLCAGLRCAGLIAVSPPAQTLAASAPTAPAFADSS